MEFTGATEEVAMNALLQTENHVGRAIELALIENDHQVSYITFCQVLFRNSYGSSVRSSAWLYDYKSSG